MNWIFLSVREWYSNYGKKLILVLYNFACSVFNNSNIHVNNNKLVNNNVNILGLFQNVRCLRIKLDVLRSTELLFNLNFYVIVKTNLNNNFFSA